MDILNDTQIRLDALTAVVRDTADAQTLLQQQVQGLTNQVVGTAAQNSGLRNLLLNGDYNFSVDAFDNSPMVGGNPGFEAKRWYRYPTTITTCNTTATSTNVVSPNGEFTAERFGASNYAVIYGADTAGATLVSATFVRVDDNNATLASVAALSRVGAYIIFGVNLAQTAALALHAAGYSTYAANEGVAGSTIPIWDKTTGQCWFGQRNGKHIPAYSIDQPLVLNIATSGQFIYVPFIMKLRRPTNCLVSISAAGTTMTASAPIFTIDDVLCPVTINGAGTAGAPLAGSIATYTSSTVVDLAAPAVLGVVDAPTVIGDNLVDVVFFAGIWADDKWAEADPMPLTAVKGGAHAGGSTTRVYYVVAQTDWGEFVDSAQVTVNNTLATLDANNFVQLDYGPVVGALGYNIYRQTGTNFRKIAFVPQTQYFDTTENSGSVQPSFPPIDAATRARAYVEFDLSTLPSDQAPVATEWRPFGISIPVPGSFDTSGVSQAWLRYGLRTPTNVGRQILVDRIGLSTTWGAWVESTLTAAALNPADGQSVSDQGPTGGGDPPGPGQGGGTCLALEMNVARRRADGLIEFIPAQYLAAGDRIFGRGASWVKIKRVTFHEAADLFEIVTANDVSIRCTGTHKLIAPLLNEEGTPVAQLKLGDELLTWCDGQEVLSPIVSRMPLAPARVVHITLEQSRQKIGYQYAAGDPERMVFQSNVKIMQQGQPT